MKKTREARRVVDEINRRVSEGKISRDELARIKDTLHTVFPRLLWTVNKDHFRPLRVTRE